MLLLDKQLLFFFLNLLCFSKKVILLKKFSKIKLYKVTCFSQKVILVYVRSNTFCEIYLDFFKITLFCLKLTAFNKKVSLFGQIDRFSL